MAVAADPVQSVLASNMQITFEITHNKQCPMTRVQEPVHALAGARQSLGESNMHTSPYLFLERQSCSRRKIRSRLFAFAVLALVTSRALLGPQAQAMIMRVVHAWRRDIHRKSNIRAPARAW
jgi:hypothetical protein